MAWFKLDDSTYDHPKMLPLSDAAFRLWVRAGIWSAKHLTDGYISDQVLVVLQARPKNVDELIAAKLWHTERDGVRFHDWHHYQPSRAEVEEKRRREREKKAKARNVANKNPQTGRFA